MSVQPTQTKLYYVRAGGDDDDDGEDYSLIVEATSLDDAAQLWADYYEISAALGTDHIKIKRVYEIPTMTGVAHALSWGALPLYERANSLDVPGWVKIWAKI